MTPQQIISYNIPTLYTGNSLYNITTAFSQEQGDESSIEILILTRTTHGDEEHISEEDDAFCNNTLEHIERSLLEHIKLSPDNGDYLKIHVSDHTIYFTIFHSGQY